MYGFVKKQIDENQCMVKYTNNDKQVISCPGALQNDILHNDKVVYRQEFFVGYVPIQTTIYGINKKGVPIQKVITLNRQTFYVPIKKQYHDHYIVFRFNKYEKEKYYGTLERVIGPISSDIDLAEATVNWKNNKHLVMKSNQDCPNREDILNRTILSIDPDSCIDIDDAIHIHEENGITEIGIHIADVTSFFEPNSDIDNELCHRVSSIYFEHKTCHMIPFFEDLSLKENTVRRSFSCIVFIQNDTILEYKFKKTRIQVTKNMTYDNFDEPKLFEYGKTIGKILKQDLLYYDSHKMVEMFMLLANYCSADYMTRHQYGIYRKHKKNSVSVRVELDVSIIKKIEQCYQNSAEYIAGKPESHESLQFDQYTHFTSPIRRYTDQLVHRLIYSYLSDTPFPYSKDEVEKRLTMQHMISHYMRKVVYHCKFVDIAKQLDKCTWKDGFVIQKHSNKLRVHIPDFNMDLDCTMYHIKMKDIIDQPNVSVGDRITVKLIPSIQTIEKMFVYID
jgi:exoribonuclease R